MGTSPAEVPSTETGGVSSMDVEGVAAEGVRAGEDERAMEVVSEREQEAESTNHLSFLFEALEVCYLQGGDTRRGSARGDNWHEFENALDSLVD